MAIIYSQQGSGLIHPIYYWQDASTWQGGVVPTVADNAYIRGYRTTLNQATKTTWTGYTTLTVASTTNFPNVGYFYTVTTKGERLKIDYSGKTATTFTGCTIDQSFQVFNSGGIANGNYIHSPAPYIVIDSGVTASALTYTIEQAGILQVRSGGTLHIYDYVDVYDGSFLCDDSSTIYHKKNKALSRIIGQNYQLSRIIIQGNEVRSNSTLLSNMNVGDVSINCNNANTLFAVGDKICVYDVNNRVAVKTTWNTYGAENIMFSGQTIDEGFDVCGVDSMNVYVKLRNGIEGIILTATTEGGVSTIYVDEQRFNIGDKVVINNSGYTISSVEDADFLIRDYDFSNGATLDDWTTDTGFTSNYSGFTTDGSKLRQSNTANRHIFIKDIFIKNVKVEAWLSPLDGVDSGTRSANAYGIMMNSDPAMDKNIIGNGNQANFFFITDSTNSLTLYNRYMTNNSIMSLSGYTSTMTGYTTLREECRVLAKYTLENRRGFLKAYINDKEVANNYNRSDQFYGRVGIYSASNNRLTCTRYKVYRTCQKITINTNDVFLSGMTMCQSGAEYPHYSGNTILKIASIVLDSSGHTNLAYCYHPTGFGGSYFPTVRGINSNLNTLGSASSPYILNNSSDYNYNYIDITAGADKYIVIDLMRIVTFTHVSYTEYYDSGRNNTTLVGIQIWGSNDGTTWTQIYAKTADNRLSNYGTRLRYYSTGAQSYRYIKFGSSGNSVTTNNLIVNIGVHDFSDGYTITLNNSSDFNVGDKIFINSLYNYMPEFSEGFYTNITTNLKTASDYVSGLKQYYIITGKNGNVIILDRPFVHGYLQGGETVVKMNRNTQILGSMTYALYSKGTLQLLNGSSYHRYYKFINCEFESHGTAQWNTGTDYCGISNQSYDPYNEVLFDGITYHSGYNGYSWCFHGFYTCNFQIRNSVLYNFYQIRHYYQGYQMRLLYSNNIIGDMYSDAVLFFYSRNMFFNYNMGFNIVGILINFGYSFANYVDDFTDGYSMAIRNYASCSNQVVTYSVYGIISSVSNKFVEERNSYLESSRSLYLGGNGNNIPSEELLYDAKHTGNRVSYFRNEGMFTQTTVNDYLLRPFYTKNINRYNYDISNYTYGSIIKFPNVNYLRYYSYGQIPGTSNNIIGSILFGIQFYMLDDSDFYIDLKFDYRHSLDQFNIQNYGGSNLYMYIIKNGTSIYYTSLIKNTDWTNFKYSNSIIGKGKYSILFTQLSWTGYVDVKNVTGNVYSPNGRNSLILSNNNMTIEKMLDLKVYNKTPDINKRSNGKKIILRGIR